MTSGTPTIIHAEHRSTGMPAGNQGSPFYVALERALKQRGNLIDQVCPPGDAIARRVLHDYAAMFVASDTVLPPPVCVFVDADAVSQFQHTAGPASPPFYKSPLDCQPPP